MIAGNPFTHTNGIFWSGSFDGPSGGDITISNNVVSAYFAAIYLRGIQGATISNNLIGTKADGNGTLINGGWGIQVESGKDLLIDNNLIVGLNTVPNRLERGGIFVNRTDQSRITNNTLGVTRDGVLFPFDARGILIDGDGNSASGNQVCGYSEEGVTVEKGDGNKILNNFIGVNRDNTQNLGNEVGIYVGSFPTATEVGGNIISGNHTALILGFKSDASYVHDNKIGTPAMDGRPAIPNGDGIVVEASNDTIRNNVITDSAGIGLRVGDPGRNFGDLTYEANKVDGNTISNNQIGLAITEYANNNTFGETTGNNISGNTNGPGLWDPSRKHVGDRTRGNTLR